MTAGRRCSASPQRGWAVLEAVSEARRQVLAEAIAGWSEEERTALAGSLLRLEAGLHQAKEQRGRGDRGGIDQEAAER